MSSTFIDKLALITLKDDKVALVRSHNKTLFYMPGGKREAGETDEQALCREIDEELTVCAAAELHRVLRRVHRPGGRQQDGTSAYSLLSGRLYRAAAAGRRNRRAEVVRQPRSAALFTRRRADFARSQGA